MQLLDRDMVFNATFNNISVISWRFIGGGNQSTRRKPPTSRKSLKSHKLFRAHLVMSNFSRGRHWLYR